MHSKSAAATSRKTTHQLPSHPVAFVGPDAWPRTSIRHHSPGRTRKQARATTIRTRPIWNSWKGPISADPKLSLRNASFAGKRFDVGCCYHAHCSVCVHNRLSGSPVGGLQNSRQDASVEANCRRKSSKIGVSKGNGNRQRRNSQSRHKIVPKPLLTVYKHLSQTRCKFKDRCWSHFRLALTLET